MNHPYREHEGSALWASIDSELTALERNGDIELRTAREYVVGALCQRLAPGMPSRRPASVPRGTTIERSADGTITNACDLTVDDVAGEKVQCPACESMVFQMWPEGWDAHAAHRCPGIASEGIEERKETFKLRFAYLFR